MKELKDEVYKIINKLFLKQHPIMGELIMKWSKIVGINLARKSIPLRVSFSFVQKQKIYLLHVGVSDSSTALEISFQKQIITERIAIYFGYKAIHDLKIKVTS